MNTTPKIPFHQTTTFAVFLYFVFAICLAFLGFLVWDMDQYKKDIQHTKETVCSPATYIGDGNSKMGSGRVLVCEKAYGEYIVKPYYGTP